MSSESEESRKFLKSLGKARSLGNKASQYAGMAQDPTVSKEDALRYRHYAENEIMGHQRDWRTTIALIVAIGVVASVIFILVLQNAYLWWVISSHGIVP